MNRKIKFFIILSVILNVLFIGLTCGLAIKHQERRGDHMATILAKSGIPEERSSFIEKRLNIIFDIGFPREEMNKMKEDALKVLTAENFDPAAYEAETIKFSELRSKQRKTMNEAIKNLATQLNLDERRALAEILRDMPPRRP